MTEGKEHPLFHKGPNVICDRTVKRPTELKTNETQVSQLSDPFSESWDYRLADASGAHTQSLSLPTEMTFW